MNQDVSIHTHEKHSENPDEKYLEIKIDMNVLNHLGIGLYSNTPAVLTEIIANAWDADANEVDIDIDSEKDRITIRDDGIGMSYEDLQRKFLTVGYPRRENNETTTPSGRQCMGRKGIGKLAMFSLANVIKVTSKKKGITPESFVINVNDLKENIKRGKPYQPQKNEATEVFNKDQGTVIVLEGLNKKVDKTESHLRRRIARRFSVIGGAHGFSVSINKNPVTISDRGFYSDIQLLWTFGSAESETKALCVSHKKHRHFDGVLASGAVIDGFIASVEKPEQLKKNEDNNNTITILANGRIFEEDVQKKIDDSKVFNSYLVGEIVANHFDANDKEDMAVSSRQGVQENDPRFEEFLGYIRTRLSDIAADWDVWRKEIGSKAIIDEFPKVQEWIDSLKPKYRTKAQQLINKVNVMRFNGSATEQKDMRRNIIKHQILAFEKLKIKDNLEAIDSIDIENNVEDFREVILSVEDIEANMHHDLIQQRLSIINKLIEHNQNEVKEKVVQNHIYENLWLVDPSWEHGHKPTDFELTLTEYLKSEHPDSEEGARMDIGYRTAGGKYIVLELKRPGLTVNIDKLIEQGNKYLVALRKYFSNNPGSCPIPGNIPLIDVVFLVAKSPNVPVHSKEMYDNLMRAINGKIITYTDLINQAKHAYEGHLAASAEVDRLRKIVDEI